MTLTVPVVEQTVDPMWADEINGDLTILDAHSHQSGSGVPITTEAISIDNPLSFQGYDAINLRSARFLVQSASLGGSNDKNCVYDVAGDLFFNNGSGTPVQITLGSNLFSSGTTGTFPVKSVTSNLSIPAGATYNTLLIDTTSARSITFPAAASTTAGKTFFAYDVSGQANAHPISFVPTGSDTINGANATLQVKQDYGAWVLTTDGSGGWWVLFSQMDVVPNLVTFESGINVTGTAAITGNLTAVTGTFTDVSTVGLQASAVQSLSFPSGSIVSGSIGGGPLQMLPGFSLAGLFLGATLVGDADYTMTDLDTVVISGTRSGSRTVHLPNATKGRCVIVMDAGNAGSWSLTVVPKSGQTVLGGSVDLDIQSNYLGVLLVGNGSGWYGGALPVAGVTGLTVN